MKFPKHLDIRELSLILKISEKTVKKLALSNQIPCVHEKTEIYFDTDTVLEYFQKLEGGIA